MRVCFGYSVHNGWYIKLGYKYLETFLTQLMHVIDITVTQVTAAFDTGGIKPIQCKITSKSASIKHENTVNKLIS